MASLYNRASPQQNRVLRIIEGAIRNATHAHPEIEIGPRHRRSIAKRAAGTLTAQWPEVLAAKGAKRPRSLSEDDRASFIRADHRTSQLSTASGRGALTGTKRPSLGLVKAAISARIGPMKKTDPAAALAWIDVLRLIAAMEAGDPGFPAQSRPNETGPRTPPNSFPTRGGEP